MFEPGSEFDWDAGNWNKCQKPGVSVAEIEAVFREALIVSPDPMHSTEEDRLVAIGRNFMGRMVLVIFTIRARGEDQLIRPISARYMRTKEFRRYAKDSS